jgi:hypothetical protein
MSTMKILLRFVAVATLTFLIVGCARTGSSSSAEPGASAPAEGDGSGPTMASSDVPAAMLEQVIADAASGAGVDPSGVEVISAEAVTWPDGSLGCPQPGQVYTQALVPGYRVILDVDGEDMSFHASEDGNFTFCADPQEPVDDGTTDR